MTHRILIIDDERNIHTTLGRGLELEGLQVESAFDGQGGLDKAATYCPDLVLLDLKLPDQNGLEVLDQLMALEKPPAVVMMSGHGTLESAVQATRRGALDFLEKPVDIDRLTLTVANTLKLDELGKAYTGMQKVIERRHGMVGRSSAMQGLLAQIHRAAPTKASVLVTGQSGVGKELVAKAIHDLSRRNQGAFVKMNCAAIAENLVESELFGHEKGAFTGAERRHQGRFERAHEGTLFLDEVGEMPLATQARLLRVLQEGELERVGGSGLIEVNVRIIAATNRNLPEEVAAGRFREDLYYRLNVVPIEVPALKDRLDDVPALASYLLSLALAEHELEHREFSEDAMAVLEKYHWPGNVRELAHAVARLAIMSMGPVIEAAEVQGALPGGFRPLQLTGIPEEGLLYPLLESFERQVIENRLTRFDGKVSKAAEDLGLERSHLYKKMQKLGLKR
jgi:two-component system, NtrC family, nitrogen regulation response regulator NtrX